MVPINMLARILQNQSIIMQALAFSLEEHDRNLVISGAMTPWVKSLRLAVLATDKALGVEKSDAS